MGQRKVRKASDVVKPGETVEAVILGVNRGRAPDLARPEAGAGRSLGRRPAALSVGFRDRRSQSPVLTKFGAFVQLSEGVEGMIHVSEISPESGSGNPLKSASRANGEGVW